MIDASTTMVTDLDDEAEAMALKEAQADEAMRIAEARWLERDAYDAYGPGN